MDYIYIGKIVNTHGIKGELRLLSNFRYKALVFVKGMSIYIGAQKTKEKIASYRTHKNFDMIMLESLSNINEVLKYKGMDVYIERKDIQLGNNKFLDEDLIGLSVYTDNKCIGIVTDIISNPGNDLLVIITEDKKELLIPYVDPFIKEIDLKKNKIVVNLIEGLIE
ncbi:MAG: ribosome maturation factor RimM [Bacilli bacterium]|nr:ribosome maturation factor RimM [Bacilli bacterium]